jgi:hypothetical protein
MATTTPNYDWPIPEDTDLVKDGAKAIRDLGNAIDTSAENFGGGLIHIKTADFSGAVSHSFGSNADPIFTSDFRNYRIILDNLLTATNDIDLGFRLRDNTTDLTSSSYVLQQASFSANTFTGTRATNTFAQIGGLGNDTSFRSSVILDITNPQTANRPTIQAYNEYVQTGVGTRIFLNSIAINSTTQFNGFTLMIAGGSSNNFSGTMSVYGYKI